MLFVVDVYPIWMSITENLVSLVVELKLVSAAAQKSTQGIDSIPANAAYDSNTTPLSH